MSGAMIPAGPGWRAALPEAVARGEVDPALPGLLAWAMGEAPKPEWADGEGGEIPTPEEIPTLEIPTLTRIPHAPTRGLFDGPRRGRKPGGEAVADQAGRLLASMLAEAPAVSVQAFAVACHREGIITRNTDREQRRAVRAALAGLEGVRIEGGRIITTDTTSEGGPT